MDIDIRTLNRDSLRSLANALQLVLDSRTHKRVHLGDEITVKGTLSKALKLPEILRWLDSTHNDRYLQGQEQLAELWATLSKPTQRRTLAMLDWYEPSELPWDDPRSNRRPAIAIKQPPT